MSGRPSSAVQAAMYLIQTKGYNAKQAAERVGIALSTIYRSKLYQAHRDAPVDFKQHFKGK
jgi:transposase